MLVGLEGGEKKTVALGEALNMANEQGMDLVQLSTNNGIAVCKIINYSKFLYEQKKRGKMNNKDKQELKEVRIGDGTAENDIKVKAKTADRLLKEGDKVKVTITYKGRMIMFIKRGLDKLSEFDGFITYPHTIDVKPKIDGNRAIMILSPKK